MPIYIPPKVRPSDTFLLAVEDPKVGLGEISFLDLAYGQQSCGENISCSSNSTIFIKDLIQRGQLSELGSYNFPPKRN